LTRGEVTFFNSYLARQIVGWKWLAATPSWLASTPGGTVLLRRYRTLWWLSVLAIVLLVVFLVGASQGAA
jgi:hypothetical protein